MIIKFWKYIHGYVIIDIYGFSEERFINLCANKNIFIWDIRRTSKGYRFSISTKAFFMLSPIARKTRCRVKIVKKVGLPFRFQIFKKRRFFLIGIIINILIIYSLTFFIWKVEVNGNLEYTTEEITKYLMNNDIMVGSYKGLIDCSEIDDMLLRDFHKTIWVSSEIKGTRLIINVREGEEEVVIEENDSPRDIVADKSGEIVSIITRAGAPLVKKGDIVESGDILVSGTLEIYELTTLMAVEFAASDADIQLKTSYSYSDEIELKYLEKTYLDEETATDNAFTLFEHKINIFSPSIHNNSYDKIETSNQLSLFENFYLPISVTTTTYKPYVLYEKEYEFEEAKTILEARLKDNFEKLSKSNVQIIENNVIFELSGDKVIATGEIIVVEKTGVIEYFDENLRRQNYNEYFTNDNTDTP
jgi:similar to stage IV sporulation protein